MRNQSDEAQAIVALHWFRVTDAMVGRLRTIPMGPEYDALKALIDERVVARGALVAERMMVDFDAELTELMDDGA